MAQNFGIGLVIGATVAASVSSACSTVEQKIKSARAEMGKSQSAMRRTTAAMDAKARLDGALFQSTLCFFFEQYSM